jgi:hypothetical protein
MNLRHYLVQQVINDEEMGDLLVGVPKLFEDPKQAIDWARFKYGKDGLVEKTTCSSYHPSSSGSVMPGITNAIAWLERGEYIDLHLRGDLAVRVWAVHSTVPTEAELQISELINPLARAEYIQRICADEAARVDAGCDSSYFSRERNGRVERWKREVDFSKILIGDIVRIGDSDAQVLNTDGKTMRVGWLQTGIESTYNLRRLSPAYVDRLIRP